VQTWRRVRTLRGLSADVENKPGTYGPGDYTHPKVTAIGALFLDRKRPRAWVLDRRDPAAMVADCVAFREVWAEADFVVGHNFRRHDLKLLDGLYTSLELELLPRKRIVDTYLDQPRMQGLSRSLENLADRWGSPVEKLHLSELDWERAYDGIPDALAKMRRRVTTDVQINAWLYRELVARELLVWR